jgi:hypothetical protein
MRIFPILFTAGLPAAEAIPGKQQMEVVLEWLSDEIIFGLFAWCFSDTKLHTMMRTDCL